MTNPNFDFNVDWLPTKNDYMGILLMELIGSGDYDDYEEWPEDKRILVESTIEKMLEHSVGPRFITALADVMKFSGANEPIMLFRSMIMSMDGKDLGMRPCCPECGAVLTQKIVKRDDGQDSLFYGCYVDDEHFLAEYVIRDNGVIEWVDCDRLF